MCASLLTRRRQDLAERVMMAEGMKRAAITPLRIQLG